jgi:hypothetical protein
MSISTLRNIRNEALRTGELTDAQAEAMTSKEAVGKYTSRAERSLLKETHRDLRSGKLASGPIAENTVRAATIPVLRPSAPEVYGGKYAVAAQKPALAFALVTQEIKGLRTIGAAVARALIFTSDRVGYAVGSAIGTVVGFKVD